MRRSILPASIARGARALLLTFVAGCSADSAVVPGLDGPERPAPTIVPGVTVITDAATLDGYVTSGQGLEIPLVPEGVPTTGLASRGLATRSSATSVSAVASAAMTFTLQAEVVPPSVQGQTLQATHIVLKGKRAYVAYATIGPATFGAVDVFEVDRGVPRLVSRATFATTEYYAVDLDGSDLFLVGATSDSGFAERAVLDVVDLSKNVLPQPFAAIRIQLPSYAGTGVSVDGNQVWVTSGSGGPNTGGVSIFDKKKLTMLNQFRFLDARGVHIDGKYAVVMSGTPGTARVFDEGKRTQIGAPLGIGGATIPESKGMAWLDEDWAFLAAGDGGTKIVALSGNGGIVSGSGIPTPNVSGVPAELSTTNAVYVDPREVGKTNYIFAANGEAGVQAYASDHRERKSNETPSISYLGRIGFGTAISANYVTGGDGTIFIAAGLGGLKILNY